MSAKKLEKGIDINDLSPVDLRLSIVKTLTAEFLLQTYNYIKADKKLIYKGFKKAGIAKCVGYRYQFKFFQWQDFQTAEKNPAENNLNAYFLVQNHRNFKQQKLPAIR